MNRILQRLKISKWLSVFSKEIFNHKDLKKLETGELNVIVLEDFVE